MHAKLFARTGALLVLLATCAVARAQAPVGTAFTYQGQLKLAGVPVNGTADFSFRLWDSEVGGALVDSVGLSFVDVVDGLFTVQLDFGTEAFNGEARWLEIEVEFPSGEGNWTKLVPRQPITPTPFALFAANGGGDSPWQAVGPNIYYDDGNVGIGTSAPLAAEHIRGTDLSLGAAVLHSDDIIVEQQDAVVGLYSGGAGGWGSAISLGELGATGELVDKWTLARLTSNSSRGSALRLMFGGNADYAYNSTLMHFTPSGDMGIGTDDPAERLHVSGGDMRIDGELMLYRNGVKTAATYSFTRGRVWNFHNPTTEGVVAQVGASSSDGGGILVLRDETGGTTLIELDPDSDDSAGYPASGLVRVRSTGGGPGGEIVVENDNGNMTIQALGGGTTQGGTIELFNEAGTGTIFLDGDANNDGNIGLRDADGNTGVYLRANNAAGVAGEVSLFNDAGFETVELIAAEGDATNGGQLTMRKADGTRTVLLDAEQGTDGGAYLQLNGGSGDPAAYLIGSGSSRTDATLRVNNTQADRGMAGYLTNNSNFATVHIENNGTGETMWLENNGGGHLIVARTPDRWEFWVDGDGITNSRVLRIHGGADLSEGFEIRGLQASSDDKPGSFSGETPLQALDRKVTAVEPVPGMVVSIDADNPGKLAISNRPYDRKVAGIISGAGGVNPGMLMGQDGSDADGDYPVALTGRVYCLCDASSGSIEPGDLLTTSDTPGHAMKVSDHAKAQGAIIGKAMTSLREGTGLVLVLVSLQ